MFVKTNWMIFFSMTERPHASPTKRWRRSWIDDVYVPSVLVTLNKIEGATKQSDCNHREAFMFGTRRNIVFMCAGQQMGHIKTVWSAFHSAVAASLLLINVCNDWPPVIWMRERILFFIFAFVLVFSSYCLLLFLITFLTALSLLPCHFLFVSFVTFSCCYFLLIARFVVSARVFFYPIFHFHSVSCFLHFSCFI